MTTLTGAQPAPDPYAAAQEAADALRARTGVERHDVVVILGSGWPPAAEELGAAEAEIGVADLPGFAPPAAAGHVGLLRSLSTGGQRILVFLGRTHLYEGHGVAAVTHAVRTAAAAGCRAAVLTNGCGSLREDWAPGRPILIADHLNLTATSPLCGARFVDLTALYTPRLRSLCREVDPALPEGVYAQLSGPHYETPAEIRMLRAAGADLVGMSTALEAIAAREAGMEVLGISLVTNLAAGMTGQPLDHAEVLRTGSAAASAMGRLLCGVLPGV